jgi:hypothetical protein
MYMHTCTYVNRLATARRNEIMQGLSTALPGLVTHLYATMSTQYAAYMSSNIRDPKASPHVVVLNRGLGLLQVIYSTTERITCEHTTV